MTKVSTNQSLKSLRGAARRFRLLSDEISNTPKFISEAVANELRDEIVNNYSDFVSSLDDSSQNRSDTRVWIMENGEGYRVGISGHQVVYDEFGTGTNGELSPHPDKNKYNLDDYNSGKTIRKDKYGLEFWKYRGVKTYGVPAGMFVYNAYQNVIDNEVQRIGKEKLQEAIKKSKKG